MRIPCLLSVLVAVLPLIAGAAERPNILMILADDLGYSDLGSFGSEIATPNLDRLAASGLILTSMYTAPTCSPTRSMLMSGTDNHQAGLGTMAEALLPWQRGKPGYEGYLNSQSHSIAELLRDGGYRTSMIGKWHLGMEPDQGPDRRGFEQSFTMLEGGGVHFKPSIESPTKLEKITFRENGKPVEVPDNYYDSDFYTDKLISYLEAGKETGKPFFAYAAYTSPHWPLQVPDTWIDKYRGHYNAGYDAVRMARIERMKHKGLLAPDFKPAATLPASPKNPTWDQLDAQQRKIQARKMEVYAAMVSNLDHNVGRLIAYLDRSGQLENTLVVFMSDNGPAAEPHEQFYPAGPNTDNSLENIGRRGSQVDYGVRWAEVSAAPLRLFKGTTAEGGISVPAIVQLPEGLRRQGLERAVTRVDDLAPTFLALAGLPDPGSIWKNEQKHPITGQSLLPVFEGKQTQARGMGGELFGNRYYREGDMKALALLPSRNPGDPTPPRWQLFDISRDRGEQNDLSSSQPEVLKRLQQAWADYARKVGVVPPPAQADKTQ